MLLRNAFAFQAGNAIRQRGDIQPQFTYQGFDGQTWDQQREQHRPDDQGDKQLPQSKLFREAQYDRQGDSTA